MERDEALSMYLTLFIYQQSITVATGSLATSLYIQLLTDILDYTSDRISQLQDARCVCLC